MITTKGIPDLKEPEKWSDELKDFLKQSITKDVAARPDGKTLLNVRWPAILAGPLAYSPYQHPFMKKACTNAQFVPAITEAKKAKEASKY